MRKVIDFSSQRYCFLDTFICTGDVKHGAENFLPGYILELLLIVIKYTGVCNILLTFAFVVVESSNLDNYVF